MKDRKMRVICCGFLILFLQLIPDPLRAEGILDQIGWNDPGRKDPTLLLILLIIISCVFILAYRAYLDTREKAEKRKRRLEEEALSRKEFSKRRRAAGLNEREVTLLENLLKKNKVSKPHTVFESVSVFESCVDLEVRKLMRAKVSPAEKREQGEMIMKLREKLGYCDLPGDVPLCSTRNMAVGQVCAVYGRSPVVADRLVLMIRRAEIAETGTFTFKVKFDPEKESGCNFLPGEKISLYFARESDARYRVNLTAAGNEPAGIVELYHSSDLKRRQSRNEFRLEAEVPLNIKVQKRSIKTGEEEMIPERGISARTCTLSGGGLSFVCDRLLDMKDVLEIDFEVMKHSFNGMRTKMVHMNKVDNDPGVFKYQVKFEDLSAAKREFLVKQIFELARRKSQGDESPDKEEAVLDDGIYIVN